MNVVRIRYPSRDELLTAANVALFAWTLYDIRFTHLPHLPGAVAIGEGISPYRVTSMLPCAGG